MRVLITGASGLLGSAVAKAMAPFADVTAAGFSHAAREGAQRVTMDITRPQAAADILAGGTFSHVVHCAAIRSPEECAADPARAYLVNAVAVEYLAAACRQHGARLIYVSTDYVFSGDQPPYREDARPAPVNIYGRTKLAGEYAARSAPDHLVARIPALWGGDADDPKANQKPLIELFRAGQPFAVENVLTRHFSDVADIAAALAYCIRLGLAGTVHLSADESQRKADFARAVGRLHGFDPALVENGGLSPGAEPRPLNPALDTSFYRGSGGPRIRGLLEVVADALR